MLQIFTDLLIHDDIGRFDHQDVSQIIRLYFSPPVDFFNNSQFGYRIQLIAKLTGLNYSRYQIWISKFLFQLINVNIFHEMSSNLSTLVIDGVVNQRFIDKAIKEGIKTVIAVNINPNLKIVDTTAIELYYFKDFL